MSSGWEKKPTGKYSQSVPVGGVAMTLGAHEEVCTQGDEEGATHYWQTQCAQWIHISEATTCTQEKEEERETGQNLKESCGMMERDKAEEKGRKERTNKGRMEVHGEWGRGEGEGGRKGRKGKGRWKGERMGKRKEVLKEDKKERKEMWDKGFAGMGGCEAVQDVVQASVEREMSYVGLQQSRTRQCQRVTAMRECGEVEVGNRVIWLQGIGNSCARFGMVQNLVWVAARVENVLGSSF
ncbi:hypothetical protein EDB84DRAFT_1440596 [Lactarius hengduanensis]|nr:hypothetical protein EDB84DRAFT_1440596 [Lactarius hengduanensis]